MDGSCVFGFGASILMGFSGFDVIKEDAIGLAPVGKDFTQEL